MRTPEEKKVSMISLTKILFDFNMRNKYEDRVEKLKGLIQMIMN